MRIAALPRAEAWLACRDEPLQEDALRSLGHFGPSTRTKFCGSKYGEFTQNLPNSPVYTVDPHPD